MASEDPRAQPRKAQPSQDQAEPVAIVTGAGSGIGAATAELLAERGYRVFGLDVAPTRRQWDEIRIIRADVADPEELHDAVSSVIGAAGRLDAVVANAGISFTGRVADTPLDTWQAILRVNLTAVFLLAKETAETLSRSPRGSFVATASELGMVGAAGWSAYGSAKAGLINLIKVLALEYAPTVRFNAVAPGATLTPLLIREQKRAGQAVEEAHADIPLGRAADPSEIAKAIAFLLSPAASYVTGSVLVADGGYTSH